MSFSLYDGAIPHIRGSLRTLLILLDKLEAHAASKSVPVESLLQARIVSDMLPFTFQAHTVCDTSAKLFARIEGTEPLTWKWDELKTVEDIRTRVKVVLEIVEKAEKAKFVERTDAVVTFGLAPGKSADIKASEYANGYSIPTLYFHLVAAYTILRKEGVQLGKRDYSTEFLGPYLSV